MNEMTITVTLTLLESNIDIKTWTHRISPSDESIVSIPRTLSVTEKA